MADALLYHAASLRFMHLDELESEGYGIYRKLFEPGEKGITT